MSLMVKIGLFAGVAIGLSGCASAPPPLADCPAGYVRLDEGVCMPVAKQKPKEIDQRPIPYNPNKADNSPIRLPDGQLVPYKRRVPPATAMTGEKSTNPFAKTGAQAVPAGSD